MPSVPSRSLSNQFGEQVLIPASQPGFLVFFPFAFSPTCSAELAELQEHLADFEAAGCSVWAVSTDSKYSLRAYADSAELSFDLLSDHWPHGEFSSAWGAFDVERGMATRRTFLLSGEGEVLASCSVPAGERRPWDWYEGALKLLAARRSPNSESNPAGA